MLWLVLLHHSHWNFGLLGWAPCGPPPLCCPPFSSKTPQSRPCSLGIPQKHGGCYSPIGWVAREVAQVSLTGSPRVVAQGLPSGPITPAIELGITCVTEGLALPAMKLGTAWLCCQISVCNGGGLSPPSIGLRVAWHPTSTWFRCRGVVQECVSLLDGMVPPALWVELPWVSAPPSKVDSCDYCGQCFLHCFHGLSDGIVWHHFWLLFHPPYSCSWAASLGPFSPPLEPIS